MTRPANPDDGFTLIEVLVASVVLVSGMLAVLTTVIQAQVTTHANQARTNANALVREAVEGARSVPYEQLVSPTLVSTLQGRAGLGDDQLQTPGWQIRRGGITYTVSAGACVTDDPRDGIGPHAPGTFCASGAAAAAPGACSTLLGAEATVGLPGAGATAGAVAGLGDCGLDVDFDGQVDGLLDAQGTVCVGSCDAPGVDRNPADARRIVVLVRWERGQGARYVLQAATAANPGLSGAPVITSMSSSTSLPVTGASVTSVDVAAGTSAPAQTVAAYIDGTHKGAATGSGTSWTFSWPLGSVSAGSTPSAGEVVDGGYLLGLKAFDQYAQFGQSRALTVVVNRRAPYPPQGLEVGRNGTTVELQWEPGAERDIELYRGMRATATGWTVVCETKAATCRDENPPAFGTPSYTVRAVDRDPAGSLREGAAATTRTVPLVNSPPPAPTNLVATSTSGTTVLTWSAPASGDPDIGDAIGHYRIYRDGIAYADRYDRTADASQTTWTDTQVNGQTHTYSVTAVDGNLAESPRLGPVTR